MTVTVDYNEDIHLLRLTKILSDLEPLIEKSVCNVCLRIKSVIIFEISVE